MSRSQHHTAISTHRHPRFLKRNEESLRLVFARRRSSRTHDARKGAAQHAWSRRSRASRECGSAAITSIVDTQAVKLLGEEVEVFDGPLLCRGGTSFAGMFSTFDDRVPRAIPAGVLASNAPRASHKILRGTC